MSCRTPLSLYVIAYFVLDDPPHVYLVQFSAASIKVFPAKFGGPQQKSHIFSRVLEFFNGGSSRVQQISSFSLQNRALNPGSA